MKVAGAVEAAAPLAAAGLPEEDVLGEQPETASIAATINQVVTLNSLL
jgi:hypothetical protein